MIVAEVESQSGRITGIVYDRSSKDFYATFRKDGKFMMGFTLQMDNTSGEQDAIEQAQFRAEEIEKHCRKTGSLKWELSR